MSVPHIELRVTAGTRGADDLTLTVQDKTFHYLLSDSAPEIRVSAYLDRDWPLVQARYQELFVSEDCKFESKITQVIPGSKTRTGIRLPGPMNNGEQLTVIVARKRRS